MTRIVRLTDSMSTLAKIQTSMLHAQWVASIGRSNLQCIRWISSQDTLGYVGNERADFLAGEATNGYTVTHSLGVIT